MGCRNPLYAKASLYFRLYVTDCKEMNWIINGYKYTRVCDYECD